MRRLTDSDIERINDFSVEAAISLPAYALEKDQHVLEAMRLIADAPPDPNFRLVFCRGTCLSKAYGAIARMSEDVEFKVVSTPAALQLTNTKRREALSAFGKSIVDTLEQGGFGEGAIARTARDANAYTRLDVTYESAFEKLATGDYANPFPVECISLAEALAEKLISFKVWDPALVRHLYDVHALATTSPDLLADADALGCLVGAVIAKDQADFLNQHPQFAADPHKEIVSALTFAKVSRELEAQYAAFVQDMVYSPAEGIPT
ncbi:nucleotidyl transferase AbiEii/AbiGii toxin family protein [Cupriavidus necator]